jgi:hypothetical protein
MWVTRDLGYHSAEEQAASIECMCDIDGIADTGFREGTVFVIACESAENAESA